MKKIFLIIGLFLVSYVGISQSIVQRSTGGNTVQDARLSAQYNLYVPRMLDTAAALTPPFRGLDSCGAIIYTYDVDAFWYRACNPYKHWERVGTGASLPQLPDGLYSGGDVAWSGTGLTFNVTPAVYILNGTVYNSPAGQITLPAADPTFATIDYIVLDTTGGPNVIAGVPSANPQQPSLNPQTQIGRAFVTVPANSLTPAIVTSVIYDQNLGTPTEWDVSSNGTVVWGNTNFPYHLTIAAAASNFVSGQYESFTFTDTVNSAPRQNLVIFMRLAASMTTFQNFNVNLLYQGNVVGQTLSATTGGLSRIVTGSYQTLVFPMNNFSPSNLIFDEIRITATGTGTLPQFNVDYIQFQTGIIPITTIPDQRFAFPTGDNFSNENRLFDQNSFAFNFNNGKLGFNTTAAPTSTISIGDDFGHVPTLYLSAGDASSAIIQTSVSAGLTLSSGNAMRVVPNNNAGGLFVDAGVSGANETLYRDFINTGNNTFGRIGIRKLSLGVNEFFLDAPTVAATQNYINIGDSLKLSTSNATLPDSLVTITGGIVTRTAYSVFSSTYYNSNIGSGFRLAAPFTNNIKTLFSDVTGAWDSTSNSSALTYKVDTTVISTKAYVNNNITTYFNTNVGSSFRIAIPGTNQLKTLTSGYSLTWDSATSNTLKISIDTTLMATRAYVGAAGGAGTVSAFSFSNANGFTGNVTNSTTTPQLTIATSVNGIAKGNGTALSAATSGTDYSAGTSALATGIVKSTTGTGALSIAVANTDYVTPSVTTLSSLVSVGTMTTGSISTGFIVRGVTMTLGGDATADMYYRNSLGVLTRLPNGTTGQVLTATTGNAPSWQTVAASITINSSTINSGTAGRILFQNASNQVSQSANLFWDNTNSRLGIGTASPTGLITIAAGTATVPPLRFTAGTNNTTPLSGAAEFDGTNYYLTPASAVRKRIVLTNNVTPTNGQIPIGNGTDYTVANITAGDNGTVITNGAGTISVRSNSTPQTLTSGATITWNVANGENAILVLANTGATLNIQNPVAGHTYVLRITQGTGGSRTITTWPSGTIWPNGTQITLGTAVGARNLISLFYDGTNYYAAYNTNTYQ